jgi:hypothetical protein
MARPLHRQWYDAGGMERLQRIGYYPCGTAKSADQAGKTAMVFRFLIETIERSEPASWASRVRPLYCLMRKSRWQWPEQREERRACLGIPSIVW